MGGTMIHENSLTKLQGQKEKILQKIGELGEFRQGSLSPRYRKCGKPYCHCAKEGAKGHGPLWLLTRSVKGKTVSTTIPKDHVATTFSQIETFHHFQELIHEYIETNIKICDVRLKEGKGASKEAEKKG